MKGKGREDTPKPKPNEPKPTEPVEWKVSKFDRKFLKSCNISPD